MLEGIVAVATGIALIAFAPALAGLAIGVTYISLQRYSEPVVYGVFKGVYRWVFRLTGCLLLVVGVMGLWR